MLRAALARRVAAVCFDALVPGRLGQKLEREISATFLEVQHRYFAITRCLHDGRVRGVVERARTGCS
jgi:hypothetical protein